MGSFTESGMSARIDNAEKLHTTVSGYPDYAPPAGQDMGTLRGLIDATKGAHSGTVSPRQTYSLATESRAALFSGQPLSIEKLLSPILAHVRSVYGKDAKEYTMIAQLAEKIRGNKLKSKPKTEDDKEVSQSQQSYGSVLGHMRAMTEHINGLGAKYAPANPAIELKALNAHLDNCKLASDKVTNDYKTFRMGLSLRDEYFSQLSELCQRIKDAVSSQYGNGSDEYKLIKGLKI